MPGIVGTVGATEHLPAMAEQLRHHRWYRMEEHVDQVAGVGVCRVSLGWVNPGSQPAMGSRSQVWAFMDGELYNAEQLGKQVASAGVHVAGCSDADVLLGAYLAGDRSLLASAEGKFSAVVWDGRERRLVLLNDKFGMKPLYYALWDECFVFASEIKALLEHPRATAEPNHKGIAQFFSFGQLWGEETLYKSIRVLPPAAWVVYEADDRRLRVDRYWKLQPAKEARSMADRLEEIGDALDRSIERQTDVKEPLGLALSGGLDARTVLALAARRGRRPVCINYAMPGSLDQKSSQRLAELAGCTFHSHVLDQSFLSRFDAHLQRMVHLTDGHYLSQCIVMPTLPLYRRLGMCFLLRGHAGELLHMQKAYNFSLDRQAVGIRTQEALEQWLGRHLRAYLVEQLDEPLLAAMDPGEVDEVVRETIAEALAETEGWDNPVDRIAHLFVTQRLRRETAMSLVKFGSVVETRLPYVNEELIALALGTPVSWRIGERIQSHILRRSAPEFLRPRNANTGAPVGAGPISRTWHYGKLRVFAKLGLPGYQPYERLGLWLRRELRPVVERHLLGERCLERGIFRPSAVRKVVHQHLSGQRNHTFLIMAMMIYELGQQAFADTGSVILGGSELSRE